MAQCSFKAALKKFPDWAKKAAWKELLQLHQQNTFEPQNAQQLTKEQIGFALEPIVTVKHKHDDSVNCHFCANGYKS